MGYDTVIPRFSYYSDYYNINYLSTLDVVPDSLLVNRYLYILPVRVTCNILFDCVSLKTTEYNI